MSDGITDARKNVAMNGVHAGQVYRHYKGGRYVVIGITWDVDDHKRSTRRVAYLCLDDGIVHHRWLWEFVSPKVHEGGREEDRFIRTGYASIGIDRNGKYTVTLEL